MNAELVQLAEMDASLYAFRYEVEPEAIRAFIGRHLGARALPRYIEQLSQCLDMSYDQSKGMDDRLLARASLIAAPSVRNRTNAEFVAGVAHATSVINDLPRRGIGSLIWNMEYVRGTRLSNTFLRFPIERQLEKAWGINVVAAFSGGDYTQAGSMDQARWNMLQTAEIAHYAGRGALKRLSTEFGIANFGRYPINQLVEQLDPSHQHRYQMPMFSARDDGNATLWLDQSPDVWVEFADQLPHDVEPVMYEASSLEQLTEQMLRVRNPLMGAINAHGRSFRFFLGDEPITVAELAEIDETTRRAVTKKWARAGGIVLLSCLAASHTDIVSRSGEPSYPIAYSLADTFSVPVVASVEEATGVNIGYHKDGDKDVVTITIIDEKYSKGARAISPASPPKPRRKRLIKLEAA